MIKEYIERVPLLKQIRAEGMNLLEQEGRRTNEVLAYGHCFSMVDLAPAVDVVEVVRCEDCIHYTRMQKPGPKADHFCRLHKGLVQITKDSFCSYGERKRK